MSFNSGLLLISSNHDLEFLLCFCFLLQVVLPIALILIFYLSFQYIEVFLIEGFDIRVGESEAEKVQFLIEL